MSIFTKVIFLRMKLHFKRAKKEGLPVIFLHGNSLDSSIFGLHSHILPENYQPVLVDLPGHGLSPKLENYTLVGITRLLCDFLNGEFQEDYMIVAHSLSGHIILQGLHALSSVKGLFLTGTPPLRSVTDIQIAFQPEASGLLFRPEWNMEELMELSKLFTKNKPDIVSVAMKRCDSNFKSDFLLPAFLDGFINEHHVLAHTKIPIYITWAEDDPFVNDDYMHDHIVTIDNKYLQFHEFKNGGHLPFIDNSHNFYNAMCNFLSSYDN